MTTLWPRFWRPTAASTTRRSAPPMPKSGWRKTMVLALSAEVFFFFFSPAMASWLAGVFGDDGGVVHSLPELWSLWSLWSLFVLFSPTSVYVLASRTAAGSPAMPARAPLLLDTYCPINSINRPSTFYLCYSAAAHSGYHHHHQDCQNQYVIACLLAMDAIRISWWAHQCTAPTAYAISSSSSSSSIIIVVSWFASSLCVYPCLRSVRTIKCWFRFPVTW